MNKFFAASTIVIALILTSCGGGVASKAQQLADEVCGCAVQAGDLEKMIENQGRSIDRKEGLECLKKNAKEYLTFFKDLEKEDRELFIKEFIKAILDTECGDVALSFAVGQIDEEDLDRAIKMIE